MLLRRTTPAPRRRSLATVLLATALTTLLLAAPTVAGATEPPPRPPEEGGSWTLESAGQGTWTVRWTSLEPLPASGDRPTVTATNPDDDLLLSAPTVTEDGRSVEATVVSEEAPDPDDLDVVLSGRALDERADAEAPPRSTVRWPAPDRELLDVDPGEPGELETRTDDYDLPSIRVAGMRQPVEVVGHVVEPVRRDASRPLVLLLHGRHESCYNPANRRVAVVWPCPRGMRPVPSHLGYDYLQQLLASQGYVTVSIAANGVNGQDGELPDAGAAARSLLARAHLNRWAEWVADGSRTADLSRVVLVGHSRGGEGLARATLDIPLTAPYRVAGQVLLAPTDFSRQSTPYVPAVTLLPYCDGDVVDLQGQAYTDVGRDVAADDTSMKSSVMVMGANHNFFNTEWTPRLAAAPAADDAWLGGECAPRSDQRLTAAEQRAVASAYVAGAVHLFAAGDERVRPLFDGTAARVASTGDAVALSHALGGRTLRRPGVNLTVTATGGAVARLCTGVTGGRVASSECGRFAVGSVETPHWPSTDPPAPSTRAAELSWSRAGQETTLDFAKAPLDLSDAASLDLRTIVDPRLGDVAVAVRVRDADGKAAQVRRTIRALPRAPDIFPGRSWAQPLRLEVPDLVGAGLDPARVTAIDLVGRSSDGRVWVLDVAVRPTAPPPVPERRAPVVDLGEVNVVEGDRAQGVAQVPFRVRGTVTAAASLRIYGIDPADGKVRHVDVRIAPGTTTGTVSWPYPGNRLDSIDRKAHMLYAYGLHNAMAADYLGRALVRDDDPAPRISFTAVAPTVPEGRRAVWRYSLSAPVDYALNVLLAPVRGSGTPLRVNDLDRVWARNWVWAPSASTPLPDAELGYFETMRPGRTSMTLSVPTRRDTVRENREQLVVQARTDEPTRVTGRATVTVLDRS